MLVLARKVGERIVIGEDVVILVVEAERGKVRLGIQAPATTPIMRAELLRSRKPTPPPAAAKEGPPCQESA